MAKFDDVNDICANADPWYLLKEVLKLAAWTVVGSGTGTGGAVYSAVADIITHGGTGAGGMANVGAWWRARDPAGLREIVVQCGTTNSNQCRILYSKSARFTGGSPSASRVPTATDQQTVYGGGTDASPTYAFLPNHTSSQYRIHIVAQSIPVGGVYGFWMNCSTTPGGAAGAGYFACEPMAPGSYKVADTDPCVFFAASTALTATPTPMFWSGAAWVTGALDTIIAPGTMLADVNDGDDVNVRPMYTSNSSTRIKGWGSYMATKGAGRNYPATTNTATDAFAYFGNFACPYPNNTAPNGA
jgi:hypothetical protein